jgi:hypothetical protein
MPSANAEGVRTKISSPNCACRLPLGRNPELWQLKHELEDDRFPQIFADYARLIRRSEEACERAAQQSAHVSHIPQTVFVISKSLMRGLLCGPLSRENEDWRGLLTGPAQSAYLYRNVDRRTVF